RELRDRDRLTIRSIRRSRVVRRLVRPEQPAATEMPLGTYTLSMRRSLSNLGAVSLSARFSRLFWNSFSLCHGGIAMAAPRRLSSTRSSEPDADPNSWDLGLLPRRRGRLTEDGRI